MLMMSVYILHTPVNTRGVKAERLCIVNSVEAAARLCSCEFRLVSLFRLQQPDCRMIKLSSF